MNIFSARTHLGWSYHKAIAACLLMIEGCIEVGSFELKNPKLSPSPFRLNFRTPEYGGNLSQDVLDVIARLIEKSLYNDDQTNVSFMAGIPRAGVPIVEALRDPSGRLWVGRREVSRADFTKHGAGASRRIKSFVPRSSKKDGEVLVLDDVLSGADTKLEAAKAIEQAGFTVNTFLVMVDRGQGGRELLESRGYRVLSIWKISELLEFYVLLDLMTEEKRSEIMDYIKRTRLA